MPTRLSMQLYFAALALLAGVSVDPGAAQADEGESAFSLNLAYAGFSVPDHHLKGGGLGFDFERGVTDDVWLRASGGGAALYDSGLPAYAGHAAIGISYVVDVLKYVPHIDLGIGGVYLHGEDIDKPLQPLIEIGGGLDLLVSRQRSYGVYTRFESFLGRTAFFTAGVRMTWRWGFF